MYLKDTHEAVTRSDYPQFFRYSDAIGAQEKLWMNRFPTPFAVAHSLTSSRPNPSFLSRYISGMDNQRVNALVEVHNREMNRPDRTMPLS